VAEFAQAAAAAETQTLGRNPSSQAIMSRFLSPLSLLLAVVVLPVVQHAQNLRMPDPVEPLSAVLEAARTHSVIALSAGSSHEDARGVDFIVSLVRDPRLAPVFNDILVEGANARFQDVMDRYVNGATVSDAEMRLIWDETTQQQIPGPIWTGEVPPIYRAVREINARLPPERRVRILLGDPPIDWATVKTPADFQQWLGQRDTFPAQVVRRDVLARGRSALVLFGTGHLQRRNQASNYQMVAPEAQTLVSLLERDGARVFVVRTAGDSQTPAQGFGIESWPIPSLALLEGTTLGTNDEPSSRMPRGMLRDGRLVPVPREEYVALPLQEQMDAILYLGPGSQARTAPTPQTICSDKTYIQMRLQRMKVGGLPPPVIDQLRTLCGL
jgi:hypothetical protein